MDILEQYEKENPEAPSPVPQWESSEEYSGLTRFVISLSRGRIQNEKQANAVLIALVVCMFLVTMLIFFFSGSSSEGKARFSTVCFPVACPK